MARCVRKLDLIPFINGFFFIRHMRESRYIVSIASLDSRMRGFMLSAVEANDENLLIIGITYVGCEVDHEAHSLFFVNLNINCRIVATNFIVTLRLTINIHHLMAG